MKLFLDMLPILVIAYLAAIGYAGLIFCDRGGKFPWPNVMSRLVRSMILIGAPVALIAYFIGWVATGGDFGRILYGRLETREQRMHPSTPEPPRTGYCF